MADSQMRPNKNLLKRLVIGALRHPCWALTILTGAMLAPFLAKPFNIDDPLFLWAAQQIQSHPGNPYGFNVNWYGVNPAYVGGDAESAVVLLLSRGGSGIFGWSEIGLHFACLLPVVAVVLGTYRLAKNFCRWPQFAALATYSRPAFSSPAQRLCPTFPCWHSGFGRSYFGLRECGKIIF